MARTSTKSHAHFSDLALQSDSAMLQSVILPAVMLASAVLLWIISLPRVDPGAMTDLGLISVLPATYFMALAIISASHLFVVHQNRSPGVIYWLNIVALIFMLHATPQIVYGTLRYSWAWKHVGIVDYIQRNGSVNPLISSLNAYHNWPGFFALAAFFNQVAGIPSSLSYAGWGPVFFNLLDLGALRMIYKGLTFDRRVAWLSVWFFFLFSWVGQDYFSPQAFTYFLYLLIFAIVLRWFRDRKLYPPASPDGMKDRHWITRLYHKAVYRASLDSLPLIRTSPVQRVSLMALLVMILSAIASSHQLTPIMLVSGLAMLVLFQFTNQRYLPLLMAVSTVVWVIFMAVGFLDGNLSWVVKSFGSFFQNINGNLLNLKIASPGQQLIAKVDRSLSLAAWGLGLMGLVRRYRRGHWDLLAASLSVAPLPMLALNGYGGEMLFRVYLFSLPFIAYLAAELFYPDIQSGRTVKTPLSATLLSFALLPGFLFGYYGKERMYYFSPNEVAAADYVFNIAPKGALIIDGTWDWPRQSVNYDLYNFISIVGFSDADTAKIINNPASEFARLMDDASLSSVYTSPAQPVDKMDEQPNQEATREANDYPAAYLVITRSQIAEAEMTGILPADWLRNLPRILSQSDNFQVIFSNADATVVEYVHRTEPGD